MKRMLAYLGILLAATILWFAWTEFVLPHTPWWQNKMDESEAWLRQEAFNHNGYVSEGYPGWTETKLPGLDSFVSVQPG